MPTGWENPSDSNAHSVVLAAAPIMKSAMMPFVHRIGSGSEWVEIFNQLNLEVLQKLSQIQQELKDDGAIYNPGPFGVGSPKPWFVDRIRAYLFQGEGSAYGLTYSEMRNSELLEGPLSEQLLGDGYTLQEVALMAEARGISFEEMLALIAATDIANAGLEIPEVPEGGAWNNDLERAYWQIELSRLIGEKLTTLTPREERVLRMRFGLFSGGEEMTLEQVAAHFGVQRERIRQIEAKALRKLKHPTRNRLLSLFTVMGIGPESSNGTNGTFASFSQESVELLAQTALENPKVLEGMSEELRSRVQRYRDIHLFVPLIPAERLEALADVMEFINFDPLPEESADLLVEMGEQETLTAPVSQGVTGIILQVALREEVRKLKLRVEAFLRLVKKHLNEDENLTDDSVMTVDHVKQDFHRLWAKYGRLIEAIKEAEEKQRMWLMHNMAGITYGDTLPNNPVRVLGSHLKDSFQGVNGFDEDRYNRTFGLRSQPKRELKPSDFDPMLGIIQRMLGPDFDSEE